MLEVVGSDLGLTREILRNAGGMACLDLEECEARATGFSVQYALSPRRRWRRLNQEVEKELGKTKEKPEVRCSTIPPQFLTTSTQLAWSRMAHVTWDLLHHKPVIFPDRDMNCGFCAMSMYSERISGLCDRNLR